MKNFNERLHGRSTAQDETHHRLEHELRQVERELQHIERAILAALVGEMTATLLKDRETRRIALAHQLRGLQHAPVRVPHPVTLSMIRTRLDDLYELLSGDSAQVNAFFRDHLTPIVCSPMEEEAQRVRRHQGHRTHGHAGIG